MSTLYGWVTLTEADAYMADRYGADDLWVSGVNKEALLATAYRDLYYCPRFNWSLDSGVDTPDAWKNAQYEQALFRLLDPGMDRRAALRAQGVTAAGVVKETYAGGKGGVPIAPIAVQMLEAYPSSTKNYIKLER